MGKIGKESNIFKNINMEVEIEEEDNTEEIMEEIVNSSTDYPIEITVDGFRVIHDHDSDNNSIYYVYDRNNTLYAEVHSTSELTEIINELKNL